MKNTKLLSLFIVGSAFTFGCGTSMTGESGNLSMGYEHGDLFEQVSRPIGAGLQADLAMSDAEYGEPINVSSAESDDAAVLDVTGLNYDEISLQGGIPGSATLSVVDSEGIADSFVLYVEAVDHVVYEDPSFYLKEESDSPYVIAAGATIWLPRTAYSASGNALTGYGLPVPNLSPVDAGVGLADDARNGMLVHFAQEGVVDVVDGGEATSYTVVDPSTVTWTVDDLDEEPGLAEEPGSLSLVGIDSRGRSVVGSLNSLDPSVCELTTFLGMNGLYAVQGRVDGECTIVLNNDPSDVVVTFTIE